MIMAILIGCLLSSRLWFSEIIKFYTVWWPQKIYSRLSCAKEPIISLLECVFMCHSILERHSYLIEGWHYQWEPKAFWQIKQKAIILYIPTERKRSGTELVLVYCFVLLDDGLQSASVLVELNDISNQTCLQADRIHHKLKNYQLLTCTSRKSDIFTISVSPDIQEIEQEGRQLWELNFWLPSVWQYL